MNELDILSLSNNKDYVIGKVLNFRNKDYLLLIEVDNDDNLLDEKLILEKSKVNNTLLLKEISDTLIFKIVSQKFAKMLLEDLI